MAHWKLDDIPWQDFDRSKITPDLVALLKAASLVEFNGDDYARYLCEVFSDDAEFQEIAKVWAKEEVQHGQALRKWAEIADPMFDFNQSFKKFTTGYSLPLNVDASVRGSRSGELIARCVVETGTSSYYTAIKEFTDEPVLKIICAKIAADEFRHYKLFYTHMKRYMELEGLGMMRRLFIMLSRIAESEDDELAYAYFAANNIHGDYDRELYTSLYLQKVRMIYKKEDMARMSGMLLKAVGLKPNGIIDRIFSRIAWFTLRRRANAAQATILQYPTKNFAPLEKAAA